MPRMQILNKAEQEIFDRPPIFNRCHINPLLTFA